MKKNKELPSLCSKKTLKKVLNAKGNLFIFMLGCLTFSLSLQAQEQKTQNKQVSLNMKNVNLEEVIWEIQKQTSYVFMYGAKEVKAVTGLNLDVKDRPALEVLDQCLKNTDLTYTIEKNNIVIKKKTVQPQQTSQEKISVEGVVKDETGETMPGVTVMVKGTTTGTATDFDGRYKLETFRTPGMVLTFSFVGMETKEVAYAGQKTLDVTLGEDTQKIEEVIVTGYQKIDRRLFTGSADIVKADELKMAGVSDVGSMLQGKSSGVQIQTVSGTFGAAPKMSVRGASSIMGDQKPLWVVDGVVLEDVVDVSPDDLSSGDANTLISSAVAGVNPDDIENVQILKDASATALYGARAMNGVVVITLKRGKKGVLRVNYAGEFTMRMKPSYRNYNIMNSQQQMMFYQDLEDKGFLNYADVSRGSNGGVYRKMYDALDEYDPTTGTFLLENTPESRRGYLQRYEKVNTDWFGLLFRNSVQQSHSVSFTAGSDKSNFFASISYLHDPGWTVADEVTRYTANMNASFDINEYLKINFLTTNSYRDQRAPGTIKQETDPVNGSVSRDFDLNPFSFALNTSRTMRPYDDNGNLEYYIMNYAPFNILNELKNNYMDINILDSKFQLELEITPMKGWDIKALGAVRLVKSSREHKIMERANLAECYRMDQDATIRKGNQYLYNDPDFPGLPAVSVLPQGGFYNRTDNRLLNYYFRTMTNFTQTLNDIHMYNVTAGMEVRSIERRETFGNGYGIQYERGNVPFIDYRILKQILERNDQYFGMDNFYDRFVAFFITGGFSFAEKYTFNLTGRYDGSNRMGQSASARWLPTWNVSGAWHLHNEPFMMGVHQVSRLTLRATYGLTAKMGPAMNAKTIYEAGVSFRPTQAERENQISIYQLENSNLTWEKQHEFNVGADVGLFNDNVSLIADMYFRKGFDLIGVLRTMGIGGEGLKYANYADMKSHGLELTLNTKNIEMPNFKWSTAVTFSYNTNEITMLTSNAKVMNLISRSGYPNLGRAVRGIYAIPFKGLNNQGFPTFINQAGVETVSNINFQESKNIDYLEYMGSADPEFTGGMNNSFKYKNLTAGLFVTYQFGSKIMLDASFKYRYNDNTATPREFADRWMVPGDEKNTDIPVVASARQIKENPNLQIAYNAYNASTARVAKGDFIRLKDVFINYELPGEWMKALKINNASLRLSASNLWLIYSDKKLKGQDPEFARSGGVALPVPRQFTLSVKVGF